jgi:hypothetical protein
MDTNRLSAVHAARQALALIDSPDPRSVSACDVAERYANGEASVVELAAAWGAAWVAWAGGGRAVDTESVIDAATDAVFEEKWKEAVGIDAATAAWDAIVASAGASTADALGSPILADAARAAAVDAAGCPQ